MSTIARIVVLPLAALGIFGGAVLGASVTHASGLAHGPQVASRQTSVAHP